MVRWAFESIYIYMVLQFGPFTKSSYELKLKSTAAEKLFENPLQWCGGPVSGEVFAIINTIATKSRKNKYNCSKTLQKDLGLKR